MSLVLGFFVGGFVARTIGPDAFGVFSSIFSIVSICAIFGTLGLDQILSKYFTLNERKPNATLGSSFFLQLTSGIAVYAALFLFLRMSEFFGSSGNGFLACMVAGLILFLQPIGFTLSCFFDSRLISRHRVIALKISALASAILKIVAMIMGGRVLALCLIWFVEMLLATILIYFFYRCQKFPPLLRWSFSWPESTRLLKDSLPLLFSAVAAYVFLYGGTIMVKYLSGTASAGFYAAATRIAEMVYFIAPAVMTSLLPSLVKLHSNDEERYRAVRREVYKGVGAASFLVIIGMLIAGPVIIRVLFGREYDQSVGIFLVQVFAIVCIYLGAVRSYFLLVEGKTRYSIVNNLSGAVLYVGLNLLLIPRYGAIGAAWTTVISYFVAYVASSFFWPATRRHGVEQIAALFAPWPKVSVIRTALQ